jgi:Na+(H+)/acetate symporter ActP
VGLLFNGLFKIPMQLLILFAGVLVFAFYMLNPSPVMFDEVSLREAKQAGATKALTALEIEQVRILAAQRQAVLHYHTPYPWRDDGVAGAGGWATEVKALEERESLVRADAKEVMARHNPGANTEDTDYIFITFVTENLPIGIVGLLIAVMFAAAMSSTAAELNALGGVAVVDFYKRSFRKEAPDRHYVRASKIATLLCGIVAIVFALVLSLFDNLIEAVNIIGSLFYGTILGVFLVAFFIKRIGSLAIIIGALSGLATILTIELLKKVGVIEIGYLWNNVIGPGVVIAVASAIQLAIGRRQSSADNLEVREEE